MCVGGGGEEEEERRKGEMSITAVIVGTCWSHLSKLLTSSMVCFNLK